MVGKNIKKIYFSFAVFLVGCYNPYPTAQQIYEMKQEYFKQILFPSNNQISFDDVKFHQILNKKSFNDEFALLTIWDVFENTESWNLEINGKQFCFSHEITVLTYLTGEKRFLTLDKSVNDFNVYSIKELENYFAKTELYIN